MDLSSMLQSEDDAALYAQQMATASALPMVLKTAIELDLLELIAKGGPDAYMSPSDLAAQLPTRNPDAPVMLDRILRLLSSFSVLKCIVKDLPGGRVERLYGLAPAGKFLAKNEDGVSMAALLLISHEKVLMESWHYFKEAILDGGYPFKKAYGTEFFDYLAKDQRLCQSFSKAMSDSSSIIVKKILQIYNGFQGLQSLVDVGGGTGATLNAIVSKNPTIKGINFDLPHVVKDAPAYQGMVHVGGDMFESIPKGDAIFIKAIFHDWDDDKSLLILRNCYESLPPNGKVIIADFILSEVPSNTLEAQNVMLADVFMLAHNAGAKERTEREFEALATEAGFKGFHKICCAYTTWIMELSK